MIPRELEPESMETAEDVEQYDAMDHSEVNNRFVADFLAAHGPCRGGEILDVGTGTALIPITLARADSYARVVGFDLAPAMIERAEQNVANAGLADRIRCIQADAKSVGAALDGIPFEAIVSNSIIHHIADPRPVLASMVDRISPGGTLMVRDLARPDTEAEVDALVERYAAGESPQARALFHASLRAALTLDEIQAIVAETGLPASCVQRTSDRHWTLIWRRPA
ncbi:class I SAM-dependent methyltransferase [Paludisphaera borealis]|uniref:Demethylrebeccamycin-D-glucose O-methyltransferase n=1 Tax=Paludisphaera borealis TaxID=1387353 RepID=A0A1U7CLZ9_9BACT|nr:class I SAM-dependent methyltransferase [Paludisphaera borealis]APW59962.1 Demethylrebeccamycin-D-glucose O-methyltransferase [Paludisphaera borealis]